MATNPQKNSLNKLEKLKSRKVIEQLFVKPQGYFYQHPIKISWLVTELETKFPAQMAVVVSKRNFAKAIHRNYIKRVLRDAYRNNKHTLYEELKKQNKQMALVVSFTSKNFEQYAAIEKGTKACLDKIINEISK